MATMEKGLLEIIRSRRSIRSYESKEVPREVLERLVEAARWAPSGSNLQPWQFVIVTDEERRREVGRWARFLFVKSHHVSEAPAVIVICGNPRSPFYLVDCALAGANILMEATALGLGTCWIGAFNEERIKEVLGIPPNLRVVALITVGYPAENPSPPPRIPLEEVLHWEGYGGGPSLRSQFVRSGPISVLPRILKMVFRRK